MGERIPGQAVGERDETVGKVVLRQPGDHCLLLHIGSRGNVNDEVTQFLPMPKRTSIKGELNDDATSLRIFFKERITKTLSEDTLL